MVEPKEITAKDAEIVAQFEPTPAMRLWLDTAVKLISDSPTEIANESKIARQTWYDWLEVEGFEDWYYENYKNKRKRWIPSLDMIGMEHAKKGKYDFWKDMRKAAGENLDDKPDVQVNILNAIQEQKTKYGI